MPLYNYVCASCGRRDRKVCSPQEALAVPECCSAPMKRDPKGPSSRCVEVIDNGLMVKRVERLTEADRLFKERSKITEKERNNQ